jgi:hypothetical protein
MQLTIDRREKRYFTLFVSTLLFLLVATFVFSYISSAINTKDYVLSNSLLDSLAADEVIPPSVKRSPSYNPNYGNYNRRELEEKAKQGDEIARKMKKLFDQGLKRLQDKNKNKSNSQKP